MKEMQDYVITISREYGSGGRDIGKGLAERLGIPFYDREIVELTAQKHGLDADSLSAMEDRAKTPFRFSFDAQVLFVLGPDTVSWISVIRQS